MSYAIIEAGGTQLRVEPGRFYDLNRLEGEPETAYVIERVLLVNHDDVVIVGQPFVAGATVEGEILSHRRGRKIIVYKMRPKKKTRKKRGHRQELTRLLIRSISVDGQAIATMAPDALTKPVLKTPGEGADLELD
jgi:large subunit ribosomal protein L21